MPILSIIVPVYNVEQYLDRCVSSILNQSFEDFELILVDDGSSDKSGLLCDQYLARDHRVRVIHKKNGGLADARNAGLDIAKGTYVAFVDSDDYIEKDMYEKLIKSCIDHDANISVCGRYDIENGNKVRKFALNDMIIWSREEAIKNLLNDDKIDSSACDKIFSRHLFDKYKFPIGKYNEDIFIMIKILHEANKVVHIGECKYYYDHRANSITTEIFTPRKMDLIEASREVKEFTINYYPKFQKQANNFYFKSIIYISTMFDSKTLNEKYIDERIYIKNLLKKHFFDIVFNSKIGTKEKIKVLLMLSGGYVGIINIKRKIA